MQATTRYSDKYSYDKANVHVLNLSTLSKILDETKAVYKPTPASKSRFRELRLSERLSIL